MSNPVNTTNAQNTVTNIIKTGPSNDAPPPRESIFDNQESEDVKIDLSGFDRLKGLTTPEPEQKNLDGGKKEDNSQETTTKQGDTAKDGEQKQNIPPVQQTEEKKVEEQKPVVEHEVKPLKKVELRNTEGLEPEEAELLKKASNETFEYVKPRLLELKTVKQQLKEKEEALTKAAANRNVSVLDHEHGYLLDQEFQQCQTGISTMLNEKAFVEQQIIAIEEGQKFKKPVSDGKGGYTIVETAASPQEKMYMQNMHAQIINGINQYNGRAAQIQYGFQQRVAERRGAIKGQEDELFPHLKDPKLFETDPVLKSIKNYMVKSGFGNNELLSGFCKMYRETMAMYKILEDNEKGKQKTTVAAEVKQSTGPTNSEINTGVSNSGNKSPDEMPYDDNLWKKARGE